MLQYFLTVLLLALAAQAQIIPSYTIRAAVGVPHNNGDFGQATSAVLATPRGVAVDGAGNLYISDATDARIRMVKADGSIATIAGTGSSGKSAEQVPASSAEISIPSRVAVSPAGEVFFTDSGNNRIRKINKSGNIVTVAGTGVAGFSGDNGAAVNAQLNFPRDIAFDSAGNLYILDTNNLRVRRVSVDLFITTVAGIGVPGSDQDGVVATRAHFNYPRGIAVDFGNNIYIADTLNHRIRKIAADGTVTTIAGSGNPQFAGDGGQSIFSSINMPTAIVADQLGNIFFSDTGNNRVREISARGVISTVAGFGDPGFKGDNGAAVSAYLNGPEGLAVDAQDNIYIADVNNHRIRKVTFTGRISTVAGSDTAAGDGGQATAARLLSPSGVVFDAAGNLYVTDTNNNRVRRINREGVISTIAGTGVAGYSGDGDLAIVAQLNGPEGIAVDRAGNVYVGDTGNNVVRKISGGVISTFAGTGTVGNQGDEGAATGANLFNPTALAFDRGGNLYIADSANNRVRRVGTNGLIHNFAGDAARGFPGFSGDGGTPSAAQLNYPRGLAAADNGDVYISDFFNNRVRRVSATTSAITTVAGTGIPGYAGDGGLGNQALLYLPAGLALDGGGNLYIADTVNERVRVLSANGSINTAAGNGASGDGGDGGPAQAAYLNTPRDVAIDPLGSVYFADQDNDRVRKLGVSGTEVRAVVNAASLVPGPVAPGEIVTLFGVLLGPATGLSAQLTAAGSLPASLAGTRILFDGVAAPLIYVSANQVSAIVPYSTFARTTTQIQAEYLGRQSAAFTLPVSPANPGIFSINASGVGPGAILNQDGSINSPGNPAAAGSIIVIYATGEGLTNPPRIDGQPAGNVLPLPAPLFSVGVNIAGRPAEILFAGAAPGAVGLLQVNARIPAAVVPSSTVSVGISIGSFGSQAGITVAVR